MSPFVLATANLDKAREILEVFTAAFDAALVAMPIEFAGNPQAFVVAVPEEFEAAAEASGARAELLLLPDVEETGTTLLDNARIKARGWSATTGLLAIADDTGLEVDALGGAPGVRSARYAGEAATYADNLAKLMNELEAVRPQHRRARFATVAIGVFPDGHEVVARGEVDGMIAATPRGANGFGYDPVFVPTEGGGRTFAEMAATEKHAISHRGRAFRQLATKLANEMEP